MSPDRHPNPSSAEGSRNRPAKAAPEWIERCRRWLAAQLGREGQGYASVPGGPVTLYGTCYALLARFYLGEPIEAGPAMTDFLLGGQDPVTGWFEGPELRGFVPAQGSQHDLEHLRHHLTCATLPVCSELGLDPRHALRAAAEFCNPAVLRAWLDRRDLRRAWLEGNNLLFVGQLLVHLRDRVQDPHAGAALETWFEWLDQNVDPRTGLWGTDRGSSAADAVYGGYHQLLVYYHEDRPLHHPRALVDTVLSLQHADGGFFPGGNAGACEDVDSVDILVNVFKRLDYRRPEIRVALRRCARHILSTQNRDGGFPYCRNRPQSHMGIPGTAAAGNVSTLFPTWFRIHTLALIAQVLQDEPALRFPFRFSRALSMGWHDPRPGPIRGSGWRDRWEELPARMRAGKRWMRWQGGRVYRGLRRALGARGVRP